MSRTWASEGLGVKIDRGHVVNDKHGATNVPGLYAIGDVAGPPWLAHKASHEGVHCVEHIAGLGKPQRSTRPIPGCTYADAAGRLGRPDRSPGQGQDGLDVKVGRYPFKNHGKAIASGDADGFVKTVFDAKTGALLGAHMIGARGHRDDPGLRPRHDPGSHRGRADGHGASRTRPCREAMHEATLAAYGRGAAHLGASSPFTRRIEPSDDPQSPSADRATLVALMLDSNGYEAPAARR